MYKEPPIAEWLFMMDGLGSTSELDNTLYGLRGLYGGGVGMIGVVATSLRVDAVEDLTGSLIGRRLLYGRDDIIVVEVFGTEQIDVRTTLIALRGTLAAIITVTTVLTLSSLLLLGSNAVDVFLTLFLQVTVHTVDALDTEAGSEDGDLHLLAQFEVGGKTPLDLEVVAELGHEVVHVVHLLHHQRLLAVLRTCERDGEQDLLGVEDIVIVEQRRVQGVFDGFLHTALALAIACRHNRHTTVLENCLHIVEVKVDESVYGDDLRDALSSHGERIVGLAEGIEHGEFGINGTQALVVDHQQGIDMLLHLLHTVEGLVDLTVALKAEGDSDDTDGEDAQFFGDAGDDGRCTRAGAAAHTGGDECHTGAVGEHSADVLDALFGGQTGLLGLVACAEAFLT